jgi:hypothetical protein
MVPCSSTRLGPVAVWYSSGSGSGGSVGDKGGDGGRGGEDERCGMDAEDNSDSVLLGTAGGELSTQGSGNVTGSSTRSSSSIGSPSLSSPRIAGIS